MHVYYYCCVCVSVCLCVCVWVCGWVGVRGHQLGRLALLTWCGVKCRNELTVSLDGSKLFCTHLGYLAETTRLFFAEILPFFLYCCSLTPPACSTKCFIVCPSRDKVSPLLRTRIVAVVSLRPLAAVLHNLSFQR